jgi:hypothetical protein
MLRSILGVLVLVVALTALWAMNCSGPRPRVAEVRVSEPSGDGAPYRIAADIQNTGSGHGQVAITFRLRERGSGRTIEADRKAQLEAGETTTIIAEIAAPRGDYEPEVEVDYPPR